MVDIWYYSGMTPSADPAPSLPRGLLADDALPLYAQVATRLWADLAAHGAQVGDRLPSERTLATRYAVSRVTLRAALTELSARGMVESAAARGWFVTRHAAVPAPAPAEVETPDTAGRRAHAVEGFADYAAKHGLTTSSRVLHSTVRPATVSEAERLRIGPGAPV
ncbi:MAG: GntR family transcriptional regulator, partial [Actinomycetia bacterium]|nr:GntR family transcriptional regulator [Actinomycetes bacterium]